MKLLQNMKKKDNNKGFSLVELIIVIAIMAILVGIVGTQVIPYLNKSRTEKDRQILSSVSTAAVSAYSSNPETITGKVEITLTKGTGFAMSGGTIDSNLQKSLEQYSGYSKSKYPDWSSSSGDDKITIVYDISAGTVTVTSGSLEAVVSTI